MYTVPLETLTCTTMRMTLCKVINTTGCLAMIYVLILSYPFPLFYVCSDSSFYHRKIHYHTVYKLQHTKFVIVEKRRIDQCFSNKKSFECADICDGNSL